MTRRTCIIGLPTDQGEAVVEYCNYSSFECLVTFVDEETEDDHVTSVTVPLGHEIRTRRDITKDVIQGAVDRALGRARGELERVGSIRVKEVVKVRTWWAEDEDE